MWILFQEREHQLQSEIHGLKHEISAQSNKLQDNNNIVQQLQVHGCWDQ